jgi:hypothetical protein
VKSMQPAKHTLPNNQQAEDSSSPAPPHRPLRLRWLAAGAALLLSAFLTASAAFAQDADVAFPAGASSGELLFYPCTSCHPIPAGSKREASGRSSGHGIVLGKHAGLGTASSACAVCHGDAAENPGMLKLSGSPSVSITGDVSRVCAPCHARVYGEWKGGSHGAERTKCTAAGCHDPHAPEYAFADATSPFAGGRTATGAPHGSQPFDTSAVSAPRSPAGTPGWLLALASIGMMATTGAAGMLTMGRAG